MALFLIKNKDFFGNKTLLSSINQILNYTLNRYETNLNKFKEFMQPILELNKYDKIGIIKLNETNDLNLNFTLYLDKYKIYQPISRWYWSQHREEIFTNLLILFNNYNDLCKQIVNSYYNDKKFFESIYNKYKEFNKLLIDQLMILKDTYNDKLVDDYINKCLLLLE